MTASDSNLPQRQPASRRPSFFQRFSRRAWLLGSLVAGLGLRRPAQAEEPENEPEPEDDEMLNLVYRTLGGKQWWADRLLYFDYRIQRQAVTGHHRLLDGKNVRLAWGTFEACQHKLQEIRAEQNLPRMSGPAVIVLHGLFRSRSAMAKLAEYLRTEGKYLVLCLGYPTTRGRVADHAEQLSCVMDYLEDITEVNFVAHSLGNLVIRHYLKDQTDPERGLTPDPRIKRMVMLGPPNQGAELAEQLVPIDITRQFTGPAAWELAKSWQELAPHLATPACEFGILAGGNGTPKGRNPLLTGDDDLVVSVETTRLAGARDFRVLPVWHTTMMNNATVQQYTLEFLRHGYFQSEAERQPIPALAVAVEAPSVPQATSDAAP